MFNILLIREQEKRHVVHCLGCARKQSPNLQGFVCLEEYKLTELTQVFDAFVLHKPPPQPTQPLLVPVTTTTAATTLASTPITTPTSTVAPLPSVTTLPPPTPQQTPVATN